jgi:uncharacterized protein YjbJ (UPF0337 family)
MANFDHNQDPVNTMPRTGRPKGHSLGELTGGVCGRVSGVAGCPLARAAATAEPYGNRKDPIMGAENKAANKVTETKGKIKKKAGRGTGNTSLEAKGRTEETKGDLKQAGEKLKDAFKK